MSAAKRQRKARVEKRRDYWMVNRIMAGFDLNTRKGWAKAERGHHRFFAGLHNWCQVVAPWEAEAREILRAASPLRSGTP